jgi:hypothetical protein
MIAFETSIAGWGDLFFFLGCIAIIVWLVIVLFVDRARYRRGP